MNGQYVSRVLRTPSARKLLHGICDDLQIGRSVLLGLPQGMPEPAIWDALTEVLHDVPTKTVWAQDTEAPIATFTSQLGVQWSRNESRTVDRLIQLLHQDEDCPAVIYVLHLECISPELWGQWIAFLNDWNAATRYLQSLDNMPIALCFIAPAAQVESAGVETDALLAIHRWFGVPHILEMQLLCRDTTAYGDHYHRAMWREYVLPSLAGSDHGLLEVLWDAVFDRKMLECRLFEYARERGWDLQLVDKDVPANGVFNVRHVQPNAYLIPPWDRLWIEGAAGWTREYGIELNSAALVVLRREDELSHRLWRGQVKLLLPLLDQIRLSLCLSLEAILGNGWALRWRQPRNGDEYQAILANPLATEWSHLEQVLLGSTERRQDCLTVLQVVDQSRFIRNEIAHYRPIDYAAFERLSKLLTDRAVQEVLKQ